MPRTTIPVPPTNVTKVLDCVTWHVGRITTSNGFLTDGVLVDRNRDPRKVFEDKASKVRDLGTYVLIRLGEWDWQHGAHGVLGGVRRKRQIVEIHTGQELSAQQSEAGITLDMIADWIRHDLEWGVFDADPQFLTASRAILSENPTWGPAPSCINFQIEKGVSEQAFPIVYQTFYCSYLYDESRPGGVAGRP